MENSEGVQQTNSNTIASAERQQKESHWRQVADIAAGITDALGKPIDTGIINTVVALNVYDIHTTQSCEGHLDSGIAAPWVEIKAPETEQSKALRKRINELADAIDEFERTERPDEEVEPLYKKLHELEREARRPQLEEIQKTLHLLTQFYMNRQVVYERLLTVRGNRLESQGAQLQEIMSADDRRLKLSEYQKEMREFTAFLEKKKEKHLTLQTLLLFHM